MARFSFEQADNYGQQNAGSFFTLKDDNDTARVRFLYNGIEDIQGYAVHQVQIGDKYRYVNCIRDYNDPIDKCPLCQAQYKIVPKLFLKLYNEDTQECQIWERGKTYFQRMAGLAAHYNPLCNEVIEVQRHGKKGDMKTTYEFFPVESSPINLDDYECSEPLGTIILDKDADEMNEYLRTGEFSSSSVGVAQQRSEQPPFDGGIVRRTPQNQQQPRRAF
jgi:hypothetical protein